MFYNYLKVLLNFLKPKAAQSGEVIQMVRSINQQSHAFTRELHSNLLKSRKDMENLMPGLREPEIEKPREVDFEKREDLKEAKCITNRAYKFNNIPFFENFNNIAKINGTKILELSILERRSIVIKKRNDSMKNNSFYN